MALALLCAAGALGAAGCKYSDYTTEKIYDEAATQTDDTFKVQVNSQLASETSSDLPQLSVSQDSQDADSTVQTVPVAGEPPTSSTAIPKVAYNPDAEEGQEAPAPKQVKQKKQPQEVEQPQGPTDDTTSEVQSTPKEGDGSSTVSKKGKKGRGAGGDSGGKTGKRSTSEKKVYEDYGAFPEIPEGVEHVAAVGKCAATVAAVGDAGTIVAGEKSFLSDENVQKVLGDKLKDAKALWNGKGQLTSVKKLAALDIQVVYVDEGSEALTDAQTDKLLDEGIIVYVLPDMNTVKEITTSLSIVGQTFSEGGSKKAGQRADALIDYYAEATAELKHLDGGEVAGGYDYEKSRKVESTVPNLYTLYVSDWDKTAVYEDLNGFVTSDQGAGISHLGSEWSPMSYLLSLGGVVDNAAKGRYGYLDAGYSAFVWQFNQNKVGANWTNWKTFDKSKQNYRILSSDGFAETLLWSIDDKCGLGSEQFPRVLVASQEIRDLMLKDAARDNGLYHPYPSVTSGSGVRTSVIGFYANGILCDACIGTSGDAFESCLNNGKTVDYYDVTVNPSGLFCSWTDGSIESILEAEWTYSLYYDEDYGIRQHVSDFYEMAYNYQLSSGELDEILAGPEE